MLTWLARFCRRLAGFIPERLKQYLKSSPYYTVLFESANLKRTGFLKKIANKFYKRVKPSIVINQHAWSGPLVSVIVTCYNYGAFLDTVLNCLEAQTLYRTQLSGGADLS